MWTPSELLALVAADGDRLLGCATYGVEGELAELVTIDAFRPGLGVGRMLIHAVVHAARSAGALRLRVMTTNDNGPALRLYQQAGFRLTELRPGAVDRAREVKPQIPALGLDGIPVRDEIDLEMSLDSG